MSETDTLVSQFLIYLPRYDDRMTVQSLLERHLLPSGEERDKYILPEIIHVL